MPCMWTQATIMHLGLADVGVVWKVTETHMLIYRFNIVGDFGLGPEIQAQRFKSIMKW